MLQATKRHHHLEDSTLAPKASMAPFFASTTNLYTSFGCHWFLIQWILMFVCLPPSSPVLFMGEEAVESTSVTRFAIYKPCWDSVDWTEPGIGAQYKDAGISGTIAQVWPKTSQVFGGNIEYFYDLLCAMVFFLWICEGSQTGGKLCLVMH